MLFVLLLWTWTSILGFTAFKVANYLSTLTFEKSFSGRFSLSNQGISITGFTVFSLELVFLFQWKLFLTSII